jgi:proton-coupled amino acid transporter
VSAFLSIVKSFAGAGSFTLPWALKQSGLLAGVIGIIILACLADYTMHLIVRCRRYIQAQEEWSNGKSDYWRVSGRSRPRQAQQSTEFGVVDSEEPTINLAKSDETDNDYIYDTHRIFNIVDLGYEAFGKIGKILVYILFFSCNLGVCTIYMVGFSDLMETMVIASQCMLTS